MFWARSDWNSGFHGNLVSTLAPSFLIGSSLYLVNQDIYNISDEFEYQPDWNKDCEVSYP